MISLKIPEVLPIFPLPETILLPSEVLPLHVFEPRYRDMVRDALQGNRIIGMTRLEPGFERNYHGDPHVYPVGCAGVIAQHQALPDGRYVIVLVGVQKFRIAEELPRSTLYRQVRVEHQPDVTTAEERASLQSLRLELIHELPEILRATRGEDISTEDLGKLDDNQLVAVATQVLQLSTDEKQALLESSGLVMRFVQLHGAVELMKRAMHPADPGDVN